MTKQIIIGVCGYMGSGKDAVAALLRMVGLHRLAFADHVREEIKNCIRRPITGGGWPEPLVRAIGQSDLEELTVEELYAKPSTPRARAAMQLWGTEYRREQDPDYWVKSVFGIIEKVRSIDYCISDVRFPNEVQAIKNKGGVIWKVHREGFGGDSHVSEQNVNSLQYDVLIRNGGTMYDLAGNVFDNWFRLKTRQQ